MKVYNNGEEILLKASHLEMATVTQILFDYSSRENDEMVKDILDVLLNPEVVKGLDLAQDLDNPYFDSDKSY